MELGNSQDKRDKQEAPKGENKSGAKNQAPSPFPYDSYVPHLIGVMPIPQKEATERQPSEQKDWVKKVIAPAVVVTIILAVLGGVYKFGKLEERVKGNDQKIGDYKKDIIEKISETKDAIDKERNNNSKNLQELYKEMNQIKQKLTKVDAYIDLEMQNMKDLKDEVEKLEKKIEEASRGNRN